MPSYDALQIFWKAGMLHHIERKQEHFVSFYSEGGKRILFPSASGVLCIHQRTVFYPAFNYIRVQRSFSVLRGHNKGHNAYVLSYVFVWYMLNA